MGCWWDGGATSRFSRTSETLSERLFGLLVTFVIKDLPAWLLCLARLTDVGRILMVLNFSQSLAAKHPGTLLADFCFTIVIKEIYWEFWWREIKIMGFDIPCEKFSSLSSQMIKDDSGKWNTAENTSEPLKGSEYLWKWKISLTGGKLQMKCAHSKGVWMMSAFRVQRLDQPWCLHFPDWDRHGSLPRF